MRLGSLSKPVVSLVLSSFLLNLAGCGTILYPERRGQPAGKYDTDVVILDAIGLLFFIVPGVVAFGVDFTTGAIYLPRGEKSRASKAFGKLEIRQYPFQGKTLEDIEGAVREHTGLAVDLRSPSTRITSAFDVRHAERQLLALNTR